MLGCKRAVQGFWPPETELTEVWGPPETVIIPSPEERQMWHLMPVEEQRKRYSRVRRQLVRAGIYRENSDVDNLYHSLTAIPGLERHDVLKRIEELVPIEVTRELTQEDVIKALDDREFLERALVALYRQQTPDEQTAENAQHLNGAGFSAHTAKYGTYLAKWVIGGKILSGFHVERAKGVCKVHAKQLVKLLAEHRKQVNS